MTVIQKYFTEVLGVVHIFAPNDSSLRPRPNAISVVMPELKNDARTLVGKMLAAIELSHYQVLNRLEGSLGISLLLGSHYLEELSAVVLAPSLGELLRGESATYFVTYGPDELLAQPKLKAVTWKHLKRFKELISEEAKVNL